MTERKARLNVIDREAERRRKLEERGPKTRLIPLLIRPGPIKKEREGGEDEEEWLLEEQRATEWLDLLYDLVIVAILTVFSSNNEVSSPESILTYFSYIVLIWWIWASQTLYDVRFQANDWLHRLFKFLELAAFAFVGITSQEFNPRNVLPPSSEMLQSDVDTAAQMQAGATAFKGVAAAYGLSRLLNGLQYLYVAYATRKYRRMSSMLIPAATCFLSFALNFIAAFLRSHASAKVSLLYVPLAIEILAMLLLPFLRGYVKTPVAIVSQRYGELTLVILGEGIIGVVRGLGNAVRGFGVGNTVYGQSVCVLLIICCAWHFLFHGFNAEIRMGRKRNILWLILHLPLHFVLLLLLAGMNNAIQYENLGNAVNQVSSAFLVLYDQGLQVVNGTGVFDLSQIPLDHLSVEYSKAGIDDQLPFTFRQAIQTFESECMQFPQNATTNPFVFWLQYDAVSLVGIEQAYGLEADDEVAATLEEFLAVNATWVPTANDTLQDQQLEPILDQLEETYFNFIGAFGTQIFEGTVFFLPTSGGLLLIVCILNLLRGMPVGLWMWLAWSAHLLVGVGLSLLGLLDLGGIKLTGETLEAGQQLSPVYKLLERGFMLPTTAISYVVLVIADAALLSIARWREGASLHKSATDESMSPSVRVPRFEEVLPLVNVAPPKGAETPAEKEGSDQGEERYWETHSRNGSQQIVDPYQDRSAEEGRGAAL